jgi:hypothetical protein
VQSRLAIIAPLLSAWSHVADALLEGAPFVSVVDARMSLADGIVLRFSAADDDPVFARRMGPANWRNLLAGF